MPEYKTPGVFVDEVVSCMRVIKAAPSGVAGFVGVVGGSVEKTGLFTSTDAFRRTFGRAAPTLEAAAKAFFDNGGRQMLLSVAATADAAGVASALEGLHDVDVVAAPGLSGPGVAAAIIAYAEAHRCMALIDPPSGLDVAGVTAFRAGLDSDHASIYWPWIVTATGLQPPSPAVAGIYNRVDIERGIWKAPANEVIHGAIGSEYNITKADQEVINPIGINALRALPGRGLRMWGARTLSIDPQWKYVNVRRQMDWILRSLDAGLAWTVFEPNSEALWARVRKTIEAFLYTHWRDGALMGTLPEQAFYARCDRVTITQNALDNGQLVALIGVAPIKPSEFITLKVVQLTADAKI